MTAMLLLVVSFAVSSCGARNEPATSEYPSGERSTYEAGDPSSAEVEPPPRSPRPTAPEPEPEPEPVDATPGFLPESVDLDRAVRPLRLQILPEFGYENEQGELILDVMERDLLYVELVVKDAERRPVRGLIPTITPAGDSRFIPLSGTAAVSDDFGSYVFGLQGGSMGEERVEIVAGDAVDSLILNVISLRAAGYGWLEDLDGVLSWPLLFKAEIHWGEQQLSATFPDDVLAKNGQIVKLVGFMLPLETALEQRHFVLASNPPSCFFHIPGGPAGAVEVFAREPFEVSWEPILLEGRFEAHETSEIGVLYRLHDARSAGPVPRSPEP